LLLEEEALADASRLESATDPATDIEASRVLGWYRWLRYLALPGDDADAELPGALGMLKRVFHSNPYAVPRPLQSWYLQAEADSYTRQRGHDESPAGNGQAAENDAARLPIFHSAVQATVRSAPASQADRTRFLLDAALMLRCIAGRSADPAVLAEAADLTLAALGDARASLPQRGDLRSLGTPQPFLESVTERQPGPAASAELDPVRVPVAIGGAAGPAALGAASPGSTRDAPGGARDAPGGGYGTRRAARRGGARREPRHVEGRRMVDRFAADDAAATEAGGY
jgi:hypothetical protein